MGGGCRARNQRRPHTPMFFSFWYGFCDWFWEAIKRAGLWEAVETRRQCTLGDQPGVVATGGTVAPEPLARRLRSCSTALCSLSLALRGLGSLGFWVCSADLFPESLTPPAASNFLERLSPTHAQPRSKILADCVN